MESASALARAEQDVWYLEPAVISVTLAIFIISASVLAYEVALMRIFAITQWHHLAYMVISVALLGFGASGTFLSLFQRSIRKRADLFLVLFSLLFSVSLVVCLSLSQTIPFNLFLVIRDWHQFLNLLLYYLIFLIPFLLGATCIGIAFMKFGGQISNLYGANLIGSGVGALAVIGLLFLLEPVSSVRVIAIASLSGPVLLSIHRRITRLVLPITLSVLGAVASAFMPVSLSISQYKTLSVIRGSVGTKILRTESSPLGRLDVVDSPAIKFNPAPGLSFRFQEEPPRVRGIVMDADAITVMTDFGGSIENARYLDYTTQALPYHLLSKPKVAIIGAGGGPGVLLALLHDAERITAVELDPKIIHLVKERYTDFCGGIYSLPQVKVVAADGRGFIESSKEKFDLIEIALMGSPGASAAGVYALAENYLCTVEGFATFLRHLTSNGVLSITNWIQFPPRDNIKAFATAVEALERLDVKNPGKHLVFIRSWKTGTILAKRTPFGEDEINALREFCQERSFDVAYYPGITRDETNKYNILSDPQSPATPEPLYYNACTALLSRNRRSVYQGYLFNVRPATDAKPFFFHFFRWKALQPLIKMMGKQWMPWGYVLLVATLVQAALASIVLILVPLLFLRKREGAVRKTRRLLYFLCLGLAFMLLEMSSMQKFVLFLRHPIYSITVVIASFLIFSGLGSLCARRFLRRASGHRFHHLLPFLAIAIISLTYLLTLGGIFSALSSLPTIARIAVSIILLAPLAFFMGMPFPRGLQNVSDSSPSLVPWCWGINGCASVLSTVLATTLAMSFGFVFVTIVAIVLYLAAGLIGT